MWIPSRLQQTLEAVSTLFFPPHCVVCKGTVPGGWLCPDCEATFRPIKPPRCEICSEPFHGEVEGRFTCPNCNGRMSHLQHAVSPYLSRGAIRQLIHGLKYYRRLYLRQILGDLLMEALADERIQREPFDAFVPVPLHPIRKREREFNQSELLARTLSKRTKIPIQMCLKRIRNTESQTHFDRDERMENLRGAFQMRQNASVSNKRLVLVDDVLTTGSTLNECARVLMEAGAHSVRAVTVARG